MNSWTDPWLLAVLVPALLEALHAVVPSYRNLFDWTDSQGRLLRYFIEGPIDAAVAQLRLLPPEQARAVVLAVIGGRTAAEVGICES